MHISFDPSGGQSKGILARIVGAVVGVVALGAALMFSAVLFVVLAIVALALWGYFWWKTRALRRTLQEQMRTQGFETPSRQAPPDPDVIEGESVRLDDERDRLK